MLKDLAVLIATLFACIGSLVLVVSFAKLLGVSPEQLHGPTFVFTPTNVVLVLLALNVPILIVLTVQSKVFKATWNSFDATRKPTKVLLLGLIMGLGLQACNYALKYAVAESVTAVSIIPESVGFIEWLMSYSWFLFVVFLNSISEELVFRVFPLVTIAKHQAQKWFVILLVSVSFSVVHFLTSEADVQSFVFRTLYGILFCQIYMKTKSFWLVVGMHTGTNLLATYLTSNWQSGGFYKITWGSEPLLLQYSLSIVLAVAIILFATVDRLKSAGEDK